MAKPRVARPQPRVVYPSGSRNRKKLLYNISLHLDQLLKFRVPNVQVCGITNSILMGPFIIVLLGWYLCFTAILHKSPFVGSTGRSAAVERRKVAEAGALVGRQSLPLRHGLFSEPFKIAVNFRGVYILCESVNHWMNGMKQLPFWGDNEPPFFRRFGFLDV